MLAKLIMSCNRHCVFLATAKMLREDHNALSRIDAEGNLDVTQICLLQKRPRKLRPLPTEVEGNLWPDYLSIVRGEILAETRSRSS